MLMKKSSSKCLNNEVCIYVISIEVNEVQNLNL